MNDFKVISRYFSMYLLRGKKFSDITTELLSHSRNFISFYMPFLKKGH